VVEGLAVFPKCFARRGRDVDSFECGSLGPCCLGNLARLYKVVGFLKLAEDGFAVGGVVL